MIKGDTAAEFGVHESQVTKVIEIFSQDLSVKVDEEADGVYIISGKGWENEPFSLYVNEDEARVLLWQLNFFLENLG